MRALGLDVGANTGHCIIEQTGKTFSWLDGGTVRHDDPALRAIIAGTPVDLVVIEAPAGYGYSAARVAALMQAAAIGGWCRAIAEECGRRVVVVTAGEVRSALCGKHNADDALVKQVLTRVVRGVPTRTSCHARDAAAAAWYGIKCDEGKRFACAQELKGRLPCSE